MYDHCGIEFFFKYSHYLIIRFKIKKKHAKTAK